jgi:predicted negative regulator of RcsB-dependent stress response|tara:strand:- start:717 stop:1346 length:630 start_codon:yes stop_codon:yes gene_type:complete
MANFFSASQEEQQEILLSFWQRFKYLIIFAFVAIVLSIVGSDYITSSSQEEDFETASLYQSYLETDDQDVGKRIIDTYSDSVYADFVRLNEAKRNFQNNDSSKAIELLKTVINNNANAEEFNPLQAAAKIRLAKIYLDNQDFNEVLSLFESTDQLTSTMLEQKADAENALGQFNKARASYMLALQNSTNQSSMALINMKISDLEGEEIE